MSQTKNFIVFTAGAAASVFLALLASSPIAAADPAPPGPGTPNAERAAAQQKPVSVPESLKTTAMYMKAIPATPALVLQSTSSFVTGAAATPAEILVASAQALGAFGVK
jgi:hypothetical protein